MTLDEMQDMLNLKPMVASQISGKKIEGCYASDMLSWVMAHAKEDQVWITIQSHQNIVAVASLLNLAAIILAEDVQADKDTLNKAMQEGIPIYSSNLSIFEICGKIYRVLEAESP